MIWNYSDSSELKMKNLKEQYTRFFGILTEQKVYVDAIEWFGSRSEASGFAKKYKLKMDSFGYSGGHNTFGLKGEKKDLLKERISYYQLKETIYLTKI
mgnify:CR=1 FL=1